VAITADGHLAVSASRDNTGSVLRQEEFASVGDVLVCWLPLPEHSFVL